VVYQVNTNTSTSSSANGRRAARAGSTQGESNLMNDAPSQYGSRALSAGRPATVGASHGVRPCAMFDM